MSNFTRKALAQQARARLFGKPVVGLSRQEITRRVRLGETPDDGWPGSQIEANPTAARLRRATEEGR